MEKLESQHGHISQGKGQIIMTKSKTILGLFITIFFIASCSSVQKSSEKVANEGVQGVSIDSGASGASGQRSSSEQAVLANATVYFEYDSYRLSSKSLQTLKSLASLLSENKSLTIVLAGHADERGTREYNLALGERRANAAKDYLMTYGISSDRISVLSYGKERPVDSGSNPLAWSKNRRAVTVKAN